MTRLRKFVAIIFILTLYLNISAFTFNSTDSETPVAIPVGGNSWIVGDLHDETGMVTSDGIVNWTDKKNIIRTFFKLPKSGTLKLGLELKVPEGESKIKCTIGSQSREIVISGNGLEKKFVGEFEINKPGYHYLELEAIEKSGAVYADIKNVLLDGEATVGDMYYVKDDFYWGRRGPSVHLSYKVPETVKNVKWFYNEITVPEGQDILGSYFMANGFAQGYFGIQVNSENERRVLFSVWSPYNTQDPNEIPEDYKIKLLKKGEGVYSGEFGNEGSGGQSYFRYNWKAGNKYSFLLKGEPVENNYTAFTAYFFAPEVGEWKLIASFKRPYTDTHLTPAPFFS